LPDSRVQEFENENKICSKADPKCIYYHIDVFCGELNENHEESCKNKRDQLNVKVMEMHLYKNKHTLVTEQMMTLQISSEEIIPKFTKMTPL